MGGVKLQMDDKRLAQYAHMVVLDGAKFTQVYADMFGTPLEPIEGYTLKSD
jgi:hypothetical protein